MKSVSKFFLGLFAAACALVPSISSAANVNYIIDTNLSSMQMNVVLDAGPPIGDLDVSTPQFAGSDIAIPTGVISAYREDDTEFGLIELLGSSFTYQNNATPMAPSFLPDGTTIEPAPQPSGSDPAQWGFNTDVFGGIVGPTALRGVDTSVTMDLQGLFLGQFDASAVTLNLLAAHNDFSYVGDGIPAFGIDPIDEQTGLDLAASSGVNGPLIGLLTAAGEIETLTIPIQARVLVFIGDVPAFLDFSGVLVAHTVPEPSTLAMVALGMIGLVTVGFRARKRNA